MRIGILGMAHLHVDAYLVNLRAADVEIVGVTDDDPLRGQRWASVNAVPWFDNAQSLLAESVDGVIICSETAGNRAHVEAAAAANVAVLCEKPLATNEDDAAAIVAACESAGVPLVTAFPMRCSPQLKQGAQFIHEGGLGQVWAVQGQNQAELPMRHRSWFVDPKLSGGGAIMDHVVHLADILRWYLGADPVEVYAATNRILHGEVVSVETGGLVMLTYPDGTFASIDCSWSKPEAYPTWGGLKLELVAEGGVVEIDGFSQHLEVHGGSNGPLSWPGWGSDANQEMIDDFLQVIANGDAPAADGQDGLAATRVALAALESSRTGQPVRMNSEA